MSAWDSRIAKWIKERGTSTIAIIGAVSLLITNDYDLITNSITILGIAQPVPFCGFVILTPLIIVAAIIIDSKSQNSWDKIWIVSFCIVFIYKVLICHILWMSVWSIILLLLIVFLVFKRENRTPIKFITINIIPFLFSGFIIINFINPGIINFLNMDLSWKSFKDNKNLHDKHLEGAILISTDFRGADLTGWRFQNAIMNKAVLSGATLEDTDFTNAKLKYADFSSMTFFGEVNMEAASLINANFDSCNMYSATGLRLDSIVNKIPLNNLEYTIFPKDFIKELENRLNQSEEDCKVLLSIIKYNDYYSSVVNDHPCY